ncbi:MAG TPA: alpha/beta fold hydrolase [Pseudonocardiaceae bacterium]|jgi:pimeloyl-ACP methyl ester carboxylesterase/predicted glycosyltransferase|nr:alpha/beta fold hydrolase [Pseudonocardiaceae bacterium]
MRAIEPDVVDFAVRDGRKIGYEVVGTGEPAIFLTPPWSIVHSRMWKAQIAFLARDHRVITADPLGNGRSDRCVDPAAYTHDALIADMLAVLDAADVGRAVLVGHCSQGWRCLLTAARHPDRVLGVVAIAPNAPGLTPPLPVRAVYSHTDELVVDDGWAKDNWHYWRRDYRGFLEFFFGELLVENHSTKQLEDCVAWGLETTPDVLMASESAPDPTMSAADTEAVLRQVRCPVLVISPTEDRCIPAERGVRVAELAGAELLSMPGAGHLPMAREPIVVNHAIRDFAARFAAPVARRWSRPVDRPRRALFLCSPIGLGHVRRDLAIAAELRSLRPDVRIDWLAQPPVSGVVAERNERVHPASHLLTTESTHIEQEAGEHDLRVFEAVRRMDEILVANFHVFDDVVRDERYDLCVADEGWEADHFLHENPELKSSAFAWLTDFVGWLPMRADEAALTADYNAEMLDHIARLPRIRDRSIFVGDPDDIVPGTFGPDLPSIRDWTEDHYDFAGYVTGFRPPADRLAVRAELGYRPDERVCLVTVGGSGVGHHLLRRVAAAYPAAARQVPGLRMVLVTGPRIDPASIPVPAGVEVVGYLPNLYQHMAACDIAVVQGGLTTTMELTSLGRPFIYVPIAGHFEQNIHVRHRLRRHGAGRRLEYRDADPERLATAIAEEIDRPVHYRPITPDGARKAAGLLADLL